MDNCIGISGRIDQIRIYSTLGAIILALLAYYILEKKSNIKSEGKKIVKNTLPQLLFRVGLGGFIIVLAVFLGTIITND